VSVSKVVDSVFEYRPIGYGASVFSGFAFKSSDLKGEGIPVIKIGNIQNRVVDYSNTQFFPEEKVTSRHEKYFLSDGDVLIAMTGQGSVGRVGKIRILNSKKILLNQRVGKFAVDNINLDNNYLYYIISSPLYESILFNAGTGSGQPNLSPQDILSVEIPYPDIKEQKAIAATLSALDDMIELNNQINKTLEEMAQAIFKSWFVDFEPFKNGEFEESELGLIPKGWRVGAIDELIKETISGDWGKETPQGNYTEKVICIRGADIPDIAQGRRGNPATRYILKRNLEKKRLSENEIIIEISGGSPTQSTGRTVLITKELINSFQEPIICTNFCRAIRLKEATYSNFVYSLLQYLYNEKVFFTYENGTTGIKNLDITILFGQYKTVIPSEEVFAEYHSMYSEFLRYIYENGFECKKLSEIRDILLPKLMSGEIRVPVEEVV
jgi:type I restriction enzyme S subunit